MITIKSASAKGSTEIQSQTDADAEIVNVIKKRARVGGTGRRIGLHFTDEGSPNEFAQQCNPPILSNDIRTISEW